MLAGRLRPIYGLTTGVGANRSIDVEPDTAGAQGLLRSHATAAGLPPPAERVRAMLLIRLNQLCAGGAGSARAVVRALADMINADALPAIREFVGIGTAELSALAATALALQARSLLGSRPDWCSVRTTRCRSSPAMRPRCRTPRWPRPLRHQRPGRAGGGRAELRRGPRQRRGLRPAGRAGHPDARRAGHRRVMRGLVGSPEPARIQDPYGLRALPQAHGILLDALSSLSAIIEAFANAPSENPLILSDGSVAHHGGFHAGYLALACDAAAIAAVQSGQLSLNRLTYASEPNHTGLEPFLGDGTPGRVRRDGGRVRGRRRAG